MGNGVNRLVACTLLTCAIGLPGCERREPTPPYARDLGEGDSPLLPPSPPWKNSEIAKGGSAEWHPFREVGTVADEPGDDDSETVSVEEAAGIEAEVRELIDEFNALVSDQDLDEMQYYFVERQRAGFDALIKAQSAVAAKVRELGEMLKEKAPDSAATVDGIIEGQLLDTVLVLEVKDLAVKGPSLVVGRLGGAEGNPLISNATREISFRVVDDEWLIDWPMLEATDALAAALQAGAEQLQPLIALVEAGTVPAEQVVQQLETAMSMLAPSDADEHGEDAEEEEAGDEDEDDDDAEDDDEEEEEEEDVEDDDAEEDGADEDS